MLRNVRVLRTNTIVKNETLTVGLSDTSPFHITNIDGLGPVSATINTTQSVFKDGSYFNSTKVQNRNIVITLSLRPNSTYPSFEACRNRIYDIFPTAGTVILEFNTDHLTKPVRITGYVEKNEPAIFTSKPMVTISLVCPDPYFAESELTIRQSIGDYENFAPDAGTAPSPVTVKKFFAKESGIFHLQRNSGGRMDFSRIPAATTLEVSFEPTNRYVTLLNRDGSKSPAYKYITGGTMEITVSNAQGHVGFFGYTQNEPGFEISFYRKFLGL